MYKCRFLDCLSLIFVVAAGSFTSYSQSIQGTTYNISEGLASSFLTDILEGKDGHIWITSQASGISRFDGNEFENFNANHGLSGLFFNTIFEDDENNIWAGGDGWLSRFDGIHWRNLQIEADIFDICALHSNKLLLCTDKGLWTIDAIDLAIVSKVHENFSFYAATQVASELIVVGNGGIFEYDQVDWQHLPTEGGNIFMDVCVDHDGVVWTIEASGSLYKRQRNQFEELVKLPIGVIPTFCSMGGLGNIYVGTKNTGIYIFETVTQDWQKMTEAQIPFNHVTKMAFDRWDDAWVTTLGGGLIKLMARNHVWHSASNGLSGSYISDLVSGPGGQVNVVYNNGSVDELTAHGIRSFAPRWIKDKRITTVDAVNRNWFGTDQGVIYARDSLVHYITEPTISHWHIRDILWQEDTSILVASAEGVHSIKLLEGDSIDSIRFTITNLHELPTWKLIDTRHGIWCLSERDLVLMRHENLLYAHTIDNKECRPTDLAVHEDVTYVATQAHGLFYLHVDEPDLVLKPCLGQDILPDKQIQSIQFDHRGRLYVGTSNGILCARMDSDHTLVQGYLYNETTALPSFHLNTGVSALAPNGAVVFGTTTGLLQLASQDHEGTNLVHPILSLLHPQINKSLSVLQLPSDENHLQVEVKAIDLSMPKGIQYYWQLDEEDEAWVKSLTGGRFSFLSLSPGDYQLRVKAENRDGVSSNIVEVPFSVLAPFYKEGWFIILMSILFASFSGLAVKRRIKKIEHKANERHAKIKMKNEMLRLEQSALKLQMNPHFIFNALQSIQAKISDGENTDARLELQNFSKLMRSYLEHARQERITLEEEIETLKKYLQIEQSLKGDSFDYSISMPKDIDPSFYQLPPMLIQPFVENAIKHGLPSRKRGSIEIAFDWKGRYLSCKIRDNGSGFNSNEAKTSHRSVGMTVTRSRLTSLLSDSQIDPLTTKNLLDSNGSVIGAKVELILPILNET